jgi:FAD/FMN-containing dehydrogenase
MDGSVRHLLSEAIGADALLDDGMSVAPASVEAVRSVLRIGADHHLPLRITSGGARPQPPAQGVVVSLRRLAALEVDAGRGVVRVEAGASLDRLRQALQGAGVAVPGFATRSRSRHAGSLVARGEVPRRSLCGLEAVLPGGEMVRLGAPLLKDVVGYDLASVILGSEGRLAAVTAVSLRLVPADATVPIFAAGGAHPVDELRTVFDPEGILIGS